MKRTLTFLLVLIAGAVQVNAQNLELTGLAGYTFRNRFPIQGGQASIEAGETYAGLLGIDVGDFGFEFLYSRQLNSVRANSRLIQEDINTPATVTYFMIGGNRYTTLPSGKVKFFGGAKFGGVTLSSREGVFNNITRFAVGLNMGSKIYLAERVGLRLQGSLNFPLMNVGASLWWSPQSGAQVGVGSSSSILQFNLLGGLFFVLN